MRRRMFLRGAFGAAVALPVLESLHWRRFIKTARAAEPGAKRLVVFFMCNGVNMETFFPNSFGALDAGKLAGTALEPLGPYAGKLLILQR